MDKDSVLVRWHEWLAEEAEIMRGLEVRGDRIH
jgi:tRNA-(ms[2]io[6]A)-hydroxylase